MPRSQLGTMGAVTLHNQQKLDSKDLGKLWSLNTTVPETIERCVHELVSIQAQARPNAPAIYASDGEMTYGELDALSTKLSGYLIQLGIKPESLVPLCFEKSMWTVVAMLAVLKAGGAFVPLDPEHPANRHEEVFNQTGAEVVLASAQYSDLWPNSERRVVIVNEASIRQLPTRTITVHPQVCPNNAAYVIFTSGSTGIPKGVVLEHRAVSTSCLGHGRAFGITGRARVLQFASYIFTDSITEIVTTLLHGGCICVPSDKDRRNDLVGAINNMNVDWAILTTSVARLLDPSDIPSLKILVIGGEHVSSADWDRWSDRVQTINGYGQTECCIICTAYVGRQEFRSGTIGTSIASVSWVVDPNNHDRLAPLGSIGELLVEGPILARGYLNDAAKTAAAFIDDPTWLVAGGGGHPGRRGRLYKTGDLVHYDADGNLVCVGRKDGQVKVRGQRVELGEIEQQLRACMPEVEQMAVEIILPARAGGQEKAMVAAFLQLDDEARKALLSDGMVVDGDSPVQAIFPAEAEKQLAHRLPSYMVPEVYFAVARLPTTTSGKTDRQWLREMGASFSVQQLAEMRTSSQGPKRQPKTEVERQMQRLWAWVLDIDADGIGLDDSFFRLGGDSIAAMKLVAEARKAGIQLVVADIFRHPKLVELVGLEGEGTIVLDDASPFSLLGLDAEVTQVHEEVAESCGLDTSVIEDIYPCSPLQEGLMSLTSKRSGDYIMQSVLELRADVDEDTFRAAWEQVVRSTAILRTRIVQHSKLGLLQAVIAGKIQWAYSSTLTEYLAQDKSTSMELAQPLTRYVLIPDPKTGRRWFVWTMHHALYDGWSLPRIWNTVQSLYAGVAPDERPRFSAFIKYLTMLDKAAVEAYWQNTLANCKAIMFPSLPPTVQQPVANGMVKFQCPSLPKTASDTTTSTLIRAAWAIVGSRYTSSDEAVFGTTVTGRNAPVAGIEAITGPTIATVPLQICLERGEGVLQLLQKVQRQSTEMIPYEQTGLQQIARVGPGARHACGFQTLLAVQPAEDELSNDDTFGVWQENTKLQDFTTYALMLQCTFAAEGIKITASFDARVIEHWVVEKMLGQFNFVMHQLAGAGLKTKVADISTTTPEDRQKLWQWNQEVPAAVERCIHDLFGEQARAQPDAPAICAWDGEMTYGELDALSSRLAGHLMRLGVKREDIVPLCFEKSMWTVVAMLGVLKAGGAFLLLDPSLPAERLALMCRKACSTRALTSVEGLSVFKDLVDATVLVNKQSILDMPECKERLPCVLPTSTAYIIFTSGSTGEPKGCRIEHRSSCSAIVHHGPSVQFNTSTRALQFGSYSFAGSLAEMLYTLVHGGCICVPSEEERRASLTSAISRMAVNWAFLTPTILNTIDGPESVPSLTTICIGGEPIRASQIQLWESHTHLRQTYGSSETAGYVSSTRLTSVSTTKDVGKAGTAVYWIVDPHDHDRLAPLGAAGELLVEGPVLGREYVGEVEKTAATFVQPPAWRRAFGGVQSCLYKTGDLARYKHDGSIELLGRKDTQVKLRGQRIELGEIEHQARLSGAVGVKGLAVELIRPENRGDMLACFIAVERSEQVEEERDELLPASCAQATVQTLRDRLEQFLPQYMVPALFVPLAQLPTTSSQKVDRKRLREMGASFTAQQLMEMQTSSQGPKRQPTTEMECTLQQLWARVLNIDADSIGLDDSFFRLGGDSIAAMKLVGEARREGVQLSVADLFRHPALVALAGLRVDHEINETEEIPAFALLGKDIDAAQVCEEVAAICSVDASLVEDIYPCSPLQEGLMSLTSKRAGDYIMQSVLELQADVDEDAFRAAWERIVRSTAILRTRIVQHSKLGLLQVVLAEDIRWVEAGALEEHLGDRLVSMGLGDPLTRYALVKEPQGGKRWFAWSVHHALYDGWSLPRILRAVTQVYSGAVLESQTSFNAFINYVVEQNHEDTKAYWQNTLAECEATLFPVLTSAVTQPVADATVEYQCLPLVKATSDTTTSTLIRAAWTIVASRYTSSDDVVFGATVTGRNAPVAGIETILGPTFSTVPVRVRVRKDQNVSAFLGGLQEQATEMIQHEQIGLHRITKMGPGARHTCSFQTLLVIQPSRDMNDSDEVLGEWHSHSAMQDFTTYALTLQCTLAAEGIKITASFDARVIEHWVVEKMLGQFNFVMHQLAGAGLKTKVADISTTTPEDRQKLWQWNQEVPAAVERCIHDLFGEQARAQPDAPAICAWDGEMTYGELDALSSRLAGHLMRLGVKREDIVPLCFEKSMWTVVAMLGVLKAGGAFLLLDPSLPTERLALMCRKASSIHVLASEKCSTVLNGFVHSIVVLNKHSIRKMPKSSTQLAPTLLTNTAYVIFTSGSTGEPKGCRIEHRSSCSAVIHHGPSMQVSSSTRVLQFGSYSFAGCLVEMLHSLIHGACICIPSEEERRTSLALVMSRMAVNWAFLTPTVLDTIGGPDSAPSLATLCIGGEPIRASQIQLWEGHVHLRQTYGSSETAGVISSAKLTRGSTIKDVGKATTAVYWIVDASDHALLAPLGVVGELLVEGPVLCREYIDDEERTASTFIQAPEWRQSFDGTAPRLYKTGDLARYKADGSIELLGRKDNQVKLRGQRIELGEIEHQARLSGAAEVKDLVVELIRPESKDDMLACFIAMEHNQQCPETIVRLLPAGCVQNTAQRIRGRLEQFLPQYMVPALFVPLAQLPTTSSQKVDRKRLREIGASFTAQQLAELQTLSQGPKQQPTTEAERQMQQLWAQVLNIAPENISLDDSFFQLGGDSISAMRLVGEARKEGVQLSVADLFRHPVLAALAGLRTNHGTHKIEEIPAFSLLGKEVDVAQVREEVSVACNIHASLVEDIYPCSPLQEGLMSLASKRSDDYIMQSVLELRADVDEDALRAAWEQVVRSTAILRTRIVQHSKHGLLQAVITENVQWVKSSSLFEYLARDKSTPMELAQPLTHYALIEESKMGKRWFVWTMHHALYDGWSLPRILHAVTQVYSGAALENQPGFNAFISYIGQQDQKSAELYWQTTLADCEALVFPSLQPTVQQPVADTTVGYQCPQFTKATSDTTTSTLIRAAWAIVASRYTSSGDVVFGTTVMGRNTPVAGIDAMIGPTIATVPVRVCVQGDQTVFAFLEDLQEQATEMIAHEQTGLQRIAKMGAGARHACSFQTLLVVQPAGDDVFEQDNMFGEWHGYSKLQNFTTYALMLQYTLAADGIKITASFDARVIEHWVVEKMLGQISYVMQQLAEADLKTKVANISTTTPEDRQELWEWNKEVPAAVERCVHDFVVEQARAQPDAPAICAWDGEMTYSELDALSTKLAGHLVQLGVKPESLVPLCFEKSMWAVVAMLAVLKAGGAFVPLDPDHPASRHEEILRQTAAAVILTSSQHLALWVHSDLHIVTVNYALVGQLPAVTETVYSLVKPGNAAYVIFTSGSTGIPKGVVLEHRAISISGLGHGRAFGFTDCTRALQFASYTFDACIAEIMTTLVFGGCVCVPSESDRRNNLTKSINIMGVNWAFLTPTVARLLEPRFVPSLKTLVLGGEQVSSADWNRWPSSVQKINGYGPTECCVFCVGFTGTQNFQSGTMGQSVASVSWVVDPNNHDRLAPLGSIGELLVEGPILARGYLDDAAKTAAAFIDDPAWLVAGSKGYPGRRGRLYKTGDLVHYDADGNLVCAGRKDGQVKVRGQRVELGEIEHQLRVCMPEVEQMAVEVILPAGAGGQEKAMVAAFLQLNDEACDAPLVGKMPENDSSLAQVVFPATADRKLAEQLPSHMIPEVYFAMRRLSMTTSGKTDRKRLREIGASFTAKQLAEMRTSSQGPKRQPTTEMERTLQQLWARVLDVEADIIGLDDSFFRLGGDSIAAMKLVGEARKEEVSISVADVFRNPKLVDLASATTHPDASSSTPIPRVDHVGPVEQSSAQGRLWFLEELYPGLDWYLMPFAVRIRGPLHLAALNTGLHAIERRHETLRTTFATNDGVSVQIVQPFNVKELTFIDLLSSDEDSRLKTIRKQQVIPFDLKTEPGWRVAVYRLTEDEYVLSIVMHHIVSDGWSVDVLMRELTTFYSASLRGQDPLSQVQPLPIQYRDFSVWQRQQAQIDEHEKQLSYWVTQLQTSRPAELLCDKPRPATLSGKADVQTLEVGGPLYAKLQQFCKARGVTLFVALLAVFRATHFRLTGQDDATIGTVNANRDRWELRDMIGFFVNMQCLRTTVEDETFEELVQQVQAVVVASLANQDVPFENIVSKLKGDRDLSRNPLAQLIFVVHSQRNLGQLTLEGVETEELDNATSSRFDLEFHFFQQPDGLQGTVFFSTDLYLPETIDNMLSVFNSVLEECLREPTARIASLPLLTDADYAKLDEMGLIRVEETLYPRESSIVDLFRQQASAHPSRVAVKDSREQMTYAALDRASDVLAEWLAKRSLAPETLVGVFANRCCETIVAFLGVMKANLAYLPFDVKTPGKRMETILSSLPGQRLIFVGANVQPPNIELSNVKFVRIAEALEEQANDQSASKRSGNITGPSATSLAYVMFTSGSTGQPKGVMVEHRGIVRLAVQNNLVEHLPATPIMAHLANLAFDASTWEIYAPLLNGGTIVCIDTMTALDPLAMLQFVNQYNIQVAFLTPALFRQYIAKSPAVVVALDMLCVGGEVSCPRDLCAAKKLLKGTLIHMYGPTENTVYSTLFVLTEHGKYPDGVPIGRALSNSGAYVMDAKLQLVPLGVVGELVVTGDGVARGYTDPERDVDRFVSVVISGQTVKAYRTGDYVRYRPTDGQLEFFGRIDGQVKLRGQRIELAEIEHVLRSHQVVGDAVAVLQHRDNDGDAQLAGFVTIREDAAMAGEQDKEASDGDEAQHVDVWEEQFDAKIYSPIDHMQPKTIGRDFIGWTSMYDGSEIDKAEMNEWPDDTIDIQRIRDEECIDLTKCRLDSIYNIPYSKTIIGRCPAESLDNTAVDTIDHQDWLSSLHQEAKSRPSLSASDLVELARQAGCRVEITWNRQHSQHGGLDAIFHKYQPVDGADKVLFRPSTDHAERPLHSLANRFIRQQMLQKTQQELLRMLQAKLPAYMVPQMITVLDAMPVNQNGKIDRTILAQRRQKQIDNREPVQQPISAAERQMQQLWARVLNIDAESIRMDDSFFRLGGDSIAAMKLVGEARKQDVSINVTDIFRSPKLASLARVMLHAEYAQQQSYSPFSLLPKTDKDSFHTLMPALPRDSETDDIADILPATRMQTLYISLGMRTPRAAHNYFFVDLGTTVDIPLLRQSCCALLQHLPILRTLFVFHGDRLWQVVLQDLDLPFTKVEFDTSLEEGSRAMCMRDREQSLPSVLPTKFMLACNSAKKYRLVIRLSHAQYDGVCIPVIMRTLLSIYQQGSLPPLPGFSTYLAYTKNRQPASARYWRELLEGSHMTNVTSKLCPKTQDATPRKVQAERVLGMPALPADITMASLVSSAWAKVLFRITGEEDVVYGHLVTGRNSKIPGVTEIVGPCLNVIPVRALISPTRTSKELIRSIQQQYVSLGESDSMDFDELVRTCTDWPATTEFDSTLQHQNVNEHPEVDLNGITRKVGWFENPYVVPDRFYIISYPQGDTLKLVAAGNTAIVTTRNAKMVLQMLYETIKELSNQF
ncbi:hypothetical protein GRF29_8g2302175 [Pseudopithomyces chartarum]|uniref:Carrier domain-containing protein n=1 Tax=Pseudopithomyces chartarum TaxID=1892770 RepID=A0AAN6M829_9PLEO|nr:hypothetical protein GRF29_8g2302175 [Pseudopithomyces chartarum]